MSVVMLQIGTKLNGVNCIFANEENRGEIFGHLFITSRSFRFFNKTDFDQHFFKYLFTEPLAGCSMLVCLRFMSVSCMNKFFPSP